MKTEEGNKLIAAFMGLDVGHDKMVLKDKVGTWTAMRYHSSWDWLMPVVEKIESIQRGGYSLRFDIAGEVCTVNDINGDFIEVSGATKIDGAYRCVIEFIEWYNKQKKSTNVALET